VDFLYFVLLIGALVLVHELGHFVAARAFGVKVLTFSIGFGPTLLRFRGKETTYRLGLLPLGGFVKLLEESPRRASGPQDDDIAPEDRKRTFQAQPLSRRAWIALAGPTMNVIVPLFLFFAVFLDGGMVVPPVIGSVVAGSPASGILRPGDRVLEIDGARVETFVDLQEAIAHHPGKRLSLKIARTVEGPNVKPHEEAIDVFVVPSAVVESRDLGASETIGRLGVGPSPLAAVIGVSDPSSPAYRAGLRTFDVVTHVGGVATPRFVDLERRLRDNPGVSVPVNFLRPTSIAWPDAASPSGPFAELAVFEPHVAVLAPEPVVAGVDDDPEANDGARRAGIEATDLFVASVPEGSSEWRAGMRSGDRIVSVDGVEIASWQALVDDLVAGADRTREVKWRRDGQIMTGLLRVRKEEWVDASGQHVERYVWRSTHWSPTVPQPLVDDPAPLRHAVRDAFVETVSVVRFIVGSAVRLLEGKIRVAAISGPIAIYDVAGRAGARGARDFLWVMALISINLGLLNLLPIPTLDGGQLLFLAIEAATRRPVPLRVREVMSIAGLTMLALLMAIALRNDILARAL
jgi:regulator of sigma E protease